MSEPQCLLELPVETVKIFFIQSYVHKSRNYSPNILVHKRGICVVDSETCTLQHSIDMDTSNEATIVDCVYIQKASSFMVALSDSSVVMVPNTSTNMSGCVSTPWPSQPINMKCFRSSSDNSRRASVVVYSADGSMTKVSLTEAGDIPISVSHDSMTQMGTVNLSAESNVSWCLGDNGSVTVVSQNIAIQSSGDLVVKKKRTSSANTSSSELGTLKIRHWNATSIEKFNTEGIQQLVEKTCSQVFEVETVLEVSEVFVDVSAQASSSAICVVTRTTNGGKLRKINAATGYEMYTRDLEKVPSQSFFVDGFLWIVNKSTEIHAIEGYLSVTCFDVVYGVQVFNDTIDIGSLSGRPGQQQSTFSSSSSSNCWVLPFCRNGETFRSNGQDLLEGSLSSNVHLLHCSIFQGESSVKVTALHRKLLLPRFSTANVYFTGSALSSTANVDKDESSIVGLCSVVGKLAPPCLSSSRVDSNGKVLSSLSGRVRRKLQQAKDSYDREVQYEQEQYFEELSEAVDRISKKARKFYLNIPADVSKEFMEKLSGATASDMQSSDWDAVKVLARTGTFSLSQYPTILSLVLDAQRLDVVGEILTHVVDLSERQAVDLLLACMFAHDSTLDRVSVSHGRVNWSGVTSGERETSSSTKKAKKGSKSSVKEESKGLKHKRVNVMCAIVGSLLCRTAAFSAVMLADSLRNRCDVASACLLMRFFVWALRGVCVSASSYSDGAINHMPILSHVDVFTKAGVVVGDIEAQRAVSWIEAIIDGHFSAISFHAMGHRPTRALLKVAITAINDARSNAESTAQLMGVWSHLCRVVYNGGEQVRPATGIYQVEELSL